MDTALQASTAEPPLEHIADLQRYIGYHPEDVQRVRVAHQLLQPHIPALIDDFYAEVERHEATREVLTGGEAQIERLKGSLREWLDELLSNDDSDEYIRRRWRVGMRHSELGLNQIYALAALARLRGGLGKLLREAWDGSHEELYLTLGALDKRLDLDLLVIETSYQSAREAKQQRTERLAAIGQMAGGLAHELRNPLNVIKTSSYYLRKARQPDSSKVEEHLERIERQVVRADAVITALSNFARMPMPSLETVHLPPLLQQVFEQEGLPGDEQDPAPGKLRLVLDLPTTLPAIKADPAQLLIVFANLVRNAIEAMPQGGRLQIRARHFNGQLEISFTDDGIGIREEDLPHIQEPLYSTKARGLGLGLALSRGILEKHHGRIDVHSIAGQGATFTVRLPAVQPSVGAGHGGNSAPSSP